MTTELQPLIEAWDGLAVITRFDKPTGTWIFICLHDNTLGPSTGGTRMKVYPAPGDALLDAMRLAEGMTHKWAGIDLGFGGAKAVLAIRRQLETDEREGLLRRYGRLVDSLGGIFLTGEDLGTSTADMAVIAEETRHIHGRDRATGEKVDPSPYTAQGVLASLQAALGHLFGSDDPAGRRVWIEGPGHVGARLAGLLAERGARLLVSDIDAGRAEAAARDYGAEVVAPDDAYDTACDVYAPCAVGATLNARTIPRLACRIVAGSANNQLETEEDADRLHERDIVYVPDYVANAGGAMAFALLEQGEPAGDGLLARVAGLGATAGEILREAAARGESPLAAARRRVDETLARRRREKEAARRG